MKLLCVCSILLLSGLTDCAPCSSVESLDISEGFVHENGSVFLYGIEFTQANSYEVEQNGTTVRYGCPCIGRICMWKCCGVSQAFYNLSCEYSSLAEVNPFSPQVYKGKEPAAVLAKDIFFYLHGRPCDDRYLVDTETGDQLFLQQNGTLMEVSTGGAQWHEPHEFCLDMGTEDLSRPPRLLGGICYPEEQTDDSPLLYTAYAIGLMLSVPFLLATFLVYALIPDLRNLHGMCLMAYCAGLIVAYPFLAYLKLHVGQVGVEMSGCMTVAFIVYYAFQTSFFWLNVMCFDIWRTFSGYRGGSTSKRRERRRFAMYGAYAWGVPLILTALTIGMQFGGVPDYLITPGFGSRRCWFVNWSSELVYFFSPVLVLVVCNVVFFTVTAHRIRSIRQETAILKGAESSRSDKLKKDKQRYGLYLKLFMVMGVNWTVELISFAVGGSNWYWIVTDISNVALGVFIFFIFVWKKKVRQLVQKRFRSMLGRETSSDGRTTRWTTSSAPTEDTRISAAGDETALRLKDMH